MLVPLIKTLEFFGVWPKLMARLAAKAPPNFGFQDYAPSKHDLIVCSFGKSGTHWLMQTALQIAHHGEAEYGSIYDLVAWPDQPPPAPHFAIPLRDETPIAASPTGLRVIKTHLDASLVPYSPEAKYIAMVRDPKDVLVSAYHFYKDLIFGPMAPSLKHWLEASFLQGYPMGMWSWAEHLASFWAWRSRPNVLFMTYEEMLTDPSAATKRVQNFMGLELSSDEFESVMRKTSFAYMKEHAIKFSYVKLAPWSKPEGATIRKGKRGSSAQHLTPDRQQRIDGFCAAQLKRLGCDFPYDEVYGQTGSSRSQRAA